MNQPFKPETASGPTCYEVTVGANGRMNLPADLRQRLGIAAPGRIFIQMNEKGEPVITTLERRLGRIRELMQPLIRPGISVVDEFIAEKRAEVAREDAETVEWLKQRG